MDTPQHKNPCHGGHKIYNFGKTFLGHHYLYTCISLCGPCTGVKKIFKKELHQLYTVYTKITTP